MCAAGSRDLALPQLRQYDLGVTRHLLCHYRRPANDNTLSPAEGAGAILVTTGITLVWALLFALAR